MATLWIGTVCFPKWTETSVCLLDEVVPSNKHSLDLSCTSSPSVVQCLLGLGCPLTGNAGIPWTGWAFSSLKLDETPHLSWTSETLCLWIVCLRPDIPILLHNLVFSEFRFSLLSTSEGWSLALWVFCFDRVFLTTRLVFPRLLPESTDHELQSANSGCRLTVCPLSCFPPEQGSGPGCVKPRSHLADLTADLSRPGWSGEVLWSRRKSGKNRDGSWKVLRGRWTWSRCPRLFQIVLNCSKRSGVVGDEEQSWIER